MSNRVSIILRFKAARHEMSCRECRVTWTSWLQRLAGISAGYTPNVNRSVSRG